PSRPLVSLEQFRRGVATSLPWHPGVFQIKKTGDHDQVLGAATEDLVGNEDIAAAGILRLRLHGPSPNALRFQTCASSRSLPSTPARRCPAVAVPRTVAWH